MINMACWKGYKQFGMKMKGGKKVPNCIPVKKAKTGLSITPSYSKTEDRYTQETNKSLTFGGEKGSITVNRQKFDVKEHPSASSRMDTISGTRRIDEKRSIFGGVGKGTGGKKSFNIGATFSFKKGGIKAYTGKAVKQPTETKKEFKMRHAYHKPFMEKPQNAYMGKFIKHDSVGIKLSNPSARAYYKDLLK